jgi:hypothetical protein
MNIAAIESAVSIAAGVWLKHSDPFTAAIEGIGRQESTGGCKNT